MFCSLDHTPKSAFKTAPMGAIDWQALDHFYGQKGEADRQKIKLTYFKKNVVINGKEHTPPALRLLINHLEELSQ